MPFQDTWRDPSPHNSGFVQNHGVRLHWLDWGGHGQPLVWLHGLGHTAHIFDAIAPSFVPNHRVLALTRRGHGRSDWPDGGYSVQALTADLAAFVDALNLHEIILVGHSIAGNEMTSLAGLMPHRIAAVVYLDAAFDRAGLAARMAHDPVKPSAPEFKVETLHDVRRLAQQHYGDAWTDALEAGLRDAVACDEEGWLTGRPAPGPFRIMQEQEHYVPEYHRVQCPALAIYATYTEDTPHWGIHADTSPDVKHAAALFMREWMIPWQRASIERFAREVKHGQVVEWPDAHHDLHLFDQDRVTKEIRRFLAHL